MSHQSCPCVKTALTVLWGVIIYNASAFVCHAHVHTNTVRIFMKRHHNAEPTYSHTAMDLFCLPLVQDAAHMIANQWLLKSSSFAPCYHTATLQWTFVCLLTGIKCKCMRFAMTSQTPAKTNAAHYSQAHIINHAGNSSDCPVVVEIFFLRSISTRKPFVTHAPSHQHPWCRAY